ncbi:MAG: S-methyl-5'-thioadenosine phosphorylase, partial [Dialister sp.]|nr:S-methyl-5'-thioadenosine phosphorylase [Dialister sp.]
PAEIKAYRMWGADVVGMTNVPECQLAREAEICYASISMVTNFAAGITKEELSHQEVLGCMEENSRNMYRIVTDVFETYDVEKDCHCHHAAEAFGGFHV